ncbi:hypothetical protein EDC94DRAFT_678332 [Helicostylum pulchrum]|nr:hypothetical protein EDC94DRAFT_678332 [Helicostylum pulchrum]
MNCLPDELLCSIFKHSIHDVSQLLALQLVCKKFHRLSNNAFLWHYAFKNMYPRWSTKIPYAQLKQPVIDWKPYMLKLYKQRLQFQRGIQLTPILSAKSKSYKIQEPIVSDIDPITNTGVLAVSKYCKFTRHKILFYSYPSYRLVRKFELKFQIDDLSEWSCQIIGMQTVHINKQKVRVFAVSINQPRPTTDSDEDDSDTDSSAAAPPDQTQVLWKVILVYRLHEDGSTTCLAHLESSSLFLGRGTWFFNDMNGDQEAIKNWLQMVSPDTLHTYDPSSSVFLLTYGLSMTRFAGYSQVMQFNLSPVHPSLDPTKTVYRWDEDLDRFIAAHEQGQHQQQNAKIISTFYLGGRVSCMIHFRYPHTLNHLIVTGNFLRSELSIYDWRFGVKVGVFPHVYSSDSSVDDTVQPWGFEFGWAIPPPLTTTIRDYTSYGPRLFVVGDCQDKFQIKVWDISQLLKVKWNPFVNKPPSNKVDSISSNQQPSRFFHDWWARGTNTLKDMVMELEENLPYNISLESICRVHLLDASIRYSAYINLNTWLYLLHEDGNLSIMDIESGNILSTVSTEGLAQDVNVVGEREVIVTRKDRLLQSLLP